VTDYAKITPAQFYRLPDGEMLLRTSAVSEARQHFSNVLTPLAGFTAEVSSIERDFAHRCASFPLFSVHRIRNSAAIRAEVSAFPDCYILQIVLSGEAVIELAGQRLVIGAGMMSVLNRGQAFCKHVSAGAEQILVRFNDQLVSATASAIVSQRSGPLRFSMLPVAVRDHPMLLGVIQNVCDDIDSGHPALSQPDIAKQMAVAIFSLLIHSLPNDGFLSPAPSVPYYVKRAEQFMMQMAGHDITLSDLVAAAGVSARSLSLSFRRFRNVSPMNRLKELRLDLAKARLSNGDDGCTVASVAEDCGLHHLSRVAKDYRARFGELPSQTLERARLRNAAECQPYRKAG
jgi:AraC-like DNA-binding protein